MSAGLEWALEACLIAYLSVGVILVLWTNSRGLKADSLFLFTWPIHLIQFLRGKD